MFVVNVSEPITFLLLTLATALLIYLGRETKKPFVPGFTLAAYLILVSMHSIQLANLTADLYETYYQVLVKCVSIDIIMIFISFFAYLWIDDLAAKHYKRKSIDNSLDWFWSNV